MDWEEVVPKHELNYIMGNPPFVGARIMDIKQKMDMHKVFGDFKGIGSLDYVSAWYKKACDYIRDTNLHCALVSTNSIAQGEQVAILWEPLFVDYDIHINFAHQSFVWDSEASMKAHVHCVIIGFSQENKKDKYLYSSESMVKKAENINAYLLDAENIFVKSRSKPIANVPAIGIGNKPIDGGNYLFTKDEMEDFIKQEPLSKDWFRPWYGAYEFINREPRYCLWLGDCPPNVLRKMPKCLERVKNVREYRLNSKSAGTRKIADKPTRFHVENIPDSDYLIIPRVSSERRKYIPIGFMEKRF